MPKRSPPNMGVLNSEAPSAAAAGEHDAERASPRGGDSYRRVDAFRLTAFPGHSPARWSEAAVADLKESILELGLLEAPRVWKLDGSETGYLVLTGHRRVRAWQLLALNRLVDRKIKVMVSTELTEREARRIMIAEESHRAEELPVGKAERIAMEFLAMSDELGREPTMEEMAAVLKPQKTAINDSMQIYRALQDPRLEPLIRAADGAGKTLLLKALRAPELSRTVAALEAFASGGASAMRKALAKRSGRPQKSVLRRKQGGGYDLTIRYRPGMLVEDRLAALAELEATKADLEAGPATG
jgi:ParB-like chromosome segregation protein Spo0J